MKNELKTCIQQQLNMVQEWILKLDMLPKITHLLVYTQS